MLTALLVALQTALPLPPATPPPHPAETAAVTAAEAWGYCVGRVSLELAGTSDTIEQIIDRSFAACAPEETKVRDRWSAYLRAIGNSPTDADIQLLIADARARARPRLAGCITTERTREPGEPRALC